MNGRRILIISHAGVNVALLRRALILRLLDEGADVHVAVPHDAHHAAVAALGATVHDWHVARGSLNPLAARGAVAHLRDIASAVRPHVAHSFTHQPNIFARLAVSPVAPLINSVTGLGSNFLGAGLAGCAKRGVFHTLYRATTRRASAVIFQNDDDRAHFEGARLLGDTPAFMIRGTGVDVTAIRPGALPAHEVAAIRAELGFAPEDVVFTLAARLIRDKGVYEFLLAARTARAALPRARFLLVGDADPANPSSIPSEALAAATADGTVTAPGWRDDMPRIWAASDVAVLPSYREGLPVGMQEALAAGLPVVVTDAPGCREVVRHGENGFAVPVADAAALAEAMATLAGDDALRHRMGVASRALAEDRFDANTLAGECIALYRRFSKEQT